MLSGHRGPSPRETGLVALLGDVSPMFLEAFCQTEHFVVCSFHGLLARGCLGRWQK